MRHIACIVTTNGITLFVDGDQKLVTPDHINYTTILEHIRRGEFDDALALVDVQATVTQWLDDNELFYLSNGLIVYNDEPFSSAVTDKVLDMIKAGNPAQPLFNFLMKLRANPSATAQEELLLFCVANGFMIHEDGDIIAYKTVRSDYTDVYSGTIRNRVGDTPSMPRYKVDDNRNRTCSTGLHFASYNYATTWNSAGERLMVVKVHPADVVSIPSDYSNQKARCSQYKVIAELADRTALPEKEVYADNDFYADSDDDDGEVCNCEFCWV